MVITIGCKSIDLFNCISFSKSSLCFVHGYPSPFTSRKFISRSSCIICEHVYFLSSLFSRMRKINRHMKQVINVLYTLVMFVKNGTSFELMFHYPEAFLDFPVSVIDSNDRSNFILRVCADRIEAIKHLFGFNSLLVNKVELALGDLSFVCPINRL